MYLKHRLVYFVEDSAQVLGMPYKGDELFMHIILPKERFGLESLMSELKGKDLLQYVQRRELVEVEVSCFSRNTGRLSITSG